MKSFLRPISTVLFGRPYDPYLPRTAVRAGSYLEGFENAVRFSRSCGFKVADPKWVVAEPLPEDGHFIEAACELAGVRDRSSAAGQCLKWSHYLAPIFEKVTGHVVWPTIGQLWKGNQSVFNPSWDDLRRWGMSGIQIPELEGRKGINLHAWLTVDTGEIIEPSLLSTLAYVNHEAYGKYSGAIAWGNDPNVVPNHRYFPMAVGNDFVEAIGTLSFAPLLAQNIIELENVAAILVPSFFTEENWSA